MQTVNPFGFWRFPIPAPGSGSCCTRSRSRLQLLGSELGFMPHFSSGITHSLGTGKIKAGKIQWFWNGGVRKWISGRTGLEEPPGVCYGAVGMWNVAERLKWIMDFLIKKKGILIFILSQRPKNNLQQHLKGQASKSPPPSPKNQHLSGFGAGYPRAPLLSRPQPNLPGLGLLVAFSIPFFLAG